jgi:hypothetical protein
MQFFNAILISSFFIFINTGCVEVRDADDKKSDQSISVDQNEKQANVNTKSFEGNLPIQIQERANTNQFMVQIEIPNGSWVLIREGKFSKTFSERQVQGGTFIDSQNIEGGEEYTYRLGTKSEKLAFVESKFSKIKLPFDLILTEQFPVFEVRGPLQVAQLNQIRKLKMGRGQRIITNGNSLAINVENAIVDFGMIETFKEKQTTSVAGQAGRSGGEIKLEIKNVIGSGHLVVVMRGENGGGGNKGADGKAYSYGNNPGHAGGAGGSSGKIFFKAPENLNIEVAHQVGVGGKGGDGGEFATSLCGSSERRDQCPFPKGPNGADGALGELGETCSFFTDQPNPWQCSLGRVF